MADSDTVQCFAALAQPTRIAILRILAGSKNGVAVHSLSKALNMRQNAVSFHLAVLARADLIAGQRVGRMVMYRLLPRRVAVMAKLLERSFVEKTT
jgi:ArsR family transcriptional regulator, arsenate/arsenite/antimonite-responsive transcriptional repressor